MGPDAQLTLEDKLTTVETVHTGPAVPLVSNDAIFQDAPGLALETLAGA